MADSKKFWNRIAKNYAQQEDSEGDKEYKDTLERTIKQLNKSDVLLDYACGPGTAAIDLASHVKKVSAIDISDKMIDIAIARAQAMSVLNIEFTEADIFDSRLQLDSFNVVTAFNILHLIDEIDDSFLKIQKLLKQDGLFISLTDSAVGMSKITALIFSLLSKIGIIPHFRQYSPDELKRRMKTCGFSVLCCENICESSTNIFIIAKKECQ